MSETRAPESLSPRLIGGQLPPLLALIHGTAAKHAPLRTHVQVHSPAVLWSNTNATYSCFLSKKADRVCEGRTM